MRPGCRVFVEIESDNADATEVGRNVAEVVEIDVELVAKDVRPVDEQPDGWVAMGVSIGGEAGTNAVKHTNW